MARRLEASQDGPELRELEVSGTGLNLCKGSLCECRTRLYECRIDSSPFAVLLSPLKSEVAGCQKRRLSQGAVAHQENEVRLARKDGRG
jgi:hypothetical protein